ncbi:5007_t:CDS:1, partial [Acaulospora morrowiae]
EKITEIPTDDSILELAKEQIRKEDIIKKNNNEDDSFERPKISIMKAQETLELLELFWLQQDGDNHKVLKSIDFQKKELLLLKQAGLIQKSLSDYF